jgi:hypothetical protein
MFGLGVWSFNDMRAFGLGPPKSAPNCHTGQPHCPAIVQSRGPAASRP